MCGINGIILKNSEPSISSITHMNQAINHRGPDANGLLKFENCILGHTRLSIQDLSEKGHQPMSVDGRYWIIFNGEIYNFKNIKQDLIDLGYIFYSNTDTEVILNAYKEWGIKSFSKFNGMWVFSILDKKTKKIIISRDRYGVKPCYFYFNDSKFIFSSEIKGLFASDIDMKIDENKCFRNPKELEGYFTTIYKNVDIIPPGTFLEINLKSLQISKKRWWKGLDNNPEISLNYKKARETLREKLISATEMRLVSDAKIAVSLSGGIDSSTIFSILNKVKYKNNIDLNPFVVKENNAVYNNALKLSNLNNTQINLVNDSTQTFENIKSNLSSLELPMVYLDQLNIYKEQKKKGFKVSIDGHGADESLGGYTKDIQFFTMESQNNITDVYKTILGMSNTDFLGKVVQRNNLLRDINSFDQSNIKLLFNNNLKVDNLFISEDIIKSSTEPLISDYLIDDLAELKYYPISYQVLYFQSNYGHLQWLLNKWDKASMAHSIEIRSPFMDWNFFQYALALPVSFKTKDGFNKSILRDAFTDLIPESIYHDKRKQGLATKINANEQKQFILDICNEENFINNNLWNGKKIKESLNNENFLLLDHNVKSIWDITKLYCLDEGFRQRTRNLTSYNECFEVKNNLLNAKNSKILAS